MLHYLPLGNIRPWMKTKLAKNPTTKHWELSFWLNWVPSTWKYAENASKNWGDVILRLNLCMNDWKTEEELLPQAGVESEGKRWGNLAFMAASASQVSPCTDWLLHKTLTEGLYLVRILEHPRTLDPSTTIQSFITPQATWETRTRNLRPQVIPR